MRRFIPLLALAAVACGGYEGTLTQRVELKKDGISGSTIANEHAISSDDSNWSAYFNQAKGALGHDPTALSFTSAALQLDASKAKNVGKLEDVVKGEVVVYVKVKDTNAIFDIAKVTDPTGTAQVELSTIGTDVSAAKYQLVKGNFEVGVRGTTVKGAGDDFDAPLSVTLGVEAE